jgi:hypothetical protein
MCLHQLLHGQWLHHPLDRQIPSAWPAAYVLQVEVETLRFQYQDLQETCSQVQTSSSYQGQQQQQQRREVEMQGGMTGDLLSHV